MAEVDQNEIEQFGPEMRAKIARQAELRDLFWEERRAYGEGQYATREQYRAGMERTITIWSELILLSTELRRAGFIPPPHRDEPTDAEREAALESLQRIVAESRERRNQRAANVASLPPPGDSQSKDRLHRTKHILSSGLTLFWQSSVLLTDILKSLGCTSEALLILEPFYKLEIYLYIYRLEKLDFRILLDNKTIEDLKSLATGMAQRDQNIIEQFDPEMRAKIARQAALQDLYWQERRACRSGEYETHDQYTASIERTTTICRELMLLGTELGRAGFIPPPHRDEPTAAQRAATLESLRRLSAEMRERRNQRLANAAPPPPPGEPQNEETESEGEEENGAGQN